MSTEKGQKAEDAACRYLERYGYQIVERNCRHGRGELDIVAVKDELLVFVEVKGHQQRESSLLAMHSDKCQRIISAAVLWQAKHQEYSTLQCRFDLLIVAPAKNSFLPQAIEHLVDVIRL